MAQEEEVKFPLQGWNVPRPPTNALFYEPTYSIGEYTVFTIGEKDKVIKGKKLYSLRKMYLDFEDITEYEFAQAVFGSWDWWNLVKNCYNFKDEIAKWPLELELKLKAKALNKIRARAADGDYKAAQFLVVKGYNKEEDNAGKGRPSKAQVAEEARKMAELDKQFESDAERLGILN